MILDPLFVFPNLLFHLMQCQVEGGDSIVRLLRRHEIVLVLRIDEQFHFGSTAAEIDSNPNRGDPVVKRQNLFGFA